MNCRLHALVLLIFLTAGGLSSQAPAPSAAKPSASAAATPAPPPPDPWIGVRFLLGSWEAKTTGGIAQAKASAGYAFRLELRDHILARHSRSGACNAPDDFDCQHSDLLYLYPVPNGGALQAIYFDNEGHIIHYDVTAPSPNSVVFLSDPAQPGPQYRLSYELVDGVLSGKFELKMPGQPDFVSYLEWSGKRR
ncbi:MAG: hypothetical protein WAN35_10565 [Terracidiphilus sp.]